MLLCPQHTIAKQEASANNVLVVMNSERLKHQRVCISLPSSSLISPRALSFLLEFVINNAARVAGIGKALFSSVREAIGILK